MKKLLTKDHQELPTHPSSHDSIYLICMALLRNELQSIRHDSPDPQHYGDSRRCVTGTSIK
jgi:hypothetical protein